MSIIIPVSCLTKEQQHYLRKTLVVQPEQNYFAVKRGAPPPPSICCYALNTGEAETYISLPYFFALQFLNKRPEEMIYRDQTGRYAFTGALLERQKSVVVEAMEQLGKFGTTTLGLYPGFGKTIIAAYLAAQLGLVTLVLYHRSVLEIQWVKAFRDFTNAKIIVSNETTLQHLIRDGVLEKAEDPTVILSMDGQVDKIDSDLLDRVGTLVIDEAHAFCVPSRLHPLLRTQPHYVIAATATLERSDSMESVIRFICGDHIITRQMEKVFHVIKLETGVTYPIPLDKRGTPSWSEYAKLHARSPERNKIILDNVLHNSGFKIMMLAGLKYHAQFLHDQLKARGEDVSLMMGSMKDYTNARVLSATMSKIGTGFDESSFCSSFDGVRINLLLLLQSIKNETTLEQSVGRVLRADAPYVIDLVDNNAIARKHWKAREKWYKAKGGIIEITKLPEQTGTLPLPEGVAVPVEPEPEEEE